jgi:hypothetical protein
MSTHPLRRRRHAGIGAGAVIGLLTIAGWSVVHQTTPAHPRSESPSDHRQQPVVVAPSRTSSSTTGEDAGVERDLRRLRTVTPVAASSQTRRIGGDQAQQPDLYAAEFVRRLLAIDFRSPRAEHLAWVQAESARTAEPLVVGLVPEDLRDRLAVYSVTDTADGDAPVPDEQEWRQLAATGTQTTVQIQRVSEPLAWTNAVADGRITDPGITGRQVAALVTRHTKGSDGDHVTKFSVALTLNLEGPPTRTTWGFVTLVTYTAIPVGAP